MRTKRKTRRHQTLPARWPSNHDLAEHFDDVEDFLTSEPVTADELRRMAIASGGTQAARARGINRK